MSGFEWVLTRFQKSPISCTCIFDGWRRWCNIGKKRLKVFFLVLIWTRSYPSFTKISNPLHMQFQCGEEMYWIMQKNSIKENRLFITFLCPYAMMDVKKSKGGWCPNAWDLATHNPTIHHIHIHDAIDKGEKRLMLRRAYWSLSIFNVSIVCIVEYSWKTKKGWWKEECMFHPHACVTKTTQSTYEQSPKYDPHVMLYKIWRFGPLPICGYLG